MKRLFVVLAMALTACGPSRAESHRRQGIALSEVGRFREAALEFSMALAEQPENVEFRRLREAAIDDAEDVEAGNLVARSVRRSRRAH